MIRKLVLPKPDYAPSILGFGPRLREAASATSARVSQAVRATVAVAMAADPSTLLSSANGIGLARIGSNWVGSEQRADVCVQAAAERPRQQNGMRQGSSATLLQNGLGSRRG